MNQDSQSNSELRLAKEAALVSITDEIEMRLKRGEQPVMADYIERHQSLADDIREIFPVLCLMTEIGDETTPGNAPPIEDSLLPHQRVGDYRIIREAGRGGMGVVYEAQHAALNRRVALKMLPDRAATEQSKARFFREARAAARLHHTSIVPVFEVGEDAGTPFYAMQFIDGRGLDELVQWAKAKEESGSDSRSSDRFWKDFIPEQPATDRRSSETNREMRRWRYIAEIGAQAAEALQYAHSHEIVHRDIKPSNLLLDREHHLWVTDFGLAKQNDDRDITATGDIVGTLRYIAPEAIRGKYDRRSDLYSLGLVLYELAALRRPFGEDDRLSMMRQIVETGPSRIASLRHDVPRDLVTIIEKAISREPSSRYQDAGGLADDLRRFLHDEPIRARQVSLLGRWWRWAKRNRALAAVSTVLMAALLSGIVGSALTAVRFSRLSNELQSSLAEQEQQTQRAEAVTDFMVEAFGKSSPTKNGNQVTVASVLDDAVTSLDEKFSDAPLTKTRLLKSFGTTYRKLGLNEQAEDAYRNALEISREHHGAEHAETIELMWRAAESQRSRDPVATLPELERAVELSRELCGPTDANTLVAETHLALVYVDLDRTNEAVELANHVLESASDENERVALAALAASDYLSHIYGEMGKHELAIDIGQRALLQATERFGEQSKAAMDVMTSLGYAYQTAKRSKEAIEILEQTLEWREKTLGENHPSTIMTMSRLGLAYNEVGAAPDALRMLRETLEKRKLISGPAHLSTLETMIHLAGTLTAIGNVKEALPLIEEVVALRKQKLGDNHSATLSAQSRLSNALMNAGRYNEASESLKSLVDRYAETLGETHAYTMHARNGLGLSYKLLGKYDKALAEYQRVLSLREAIDEDPVGILTIMANIAACHRSAGNYRKALEFYQTTYERALELVGPRHRATTTSLRGMGIVLSSLGKHEEALEKCKQAAETIAAHSGAQHIDAIIARKHLAVAQANAGCVQDSLRTFRETVADLTAVLGTDSSPDHFATLDDYGLALIRAQDFESAIKTFREAIEVQKKLPGNKAKQCRTMNRLASVLAKAGELNESNAILNEVIQLSQVDPTSSSILGNGYQSLCNNHLAQFDFEPIPQLVVQWLAARTKITQLPEPMSAQACLAEAALGQSNDAEALRIAEALLVRLAEAESEQRYFFPTKLFRAQALSIRGAVLGHREQWEDAERDLLSGHEYFSQWIAARPDKDWLLRNSMKRLADLYSRWGKEERADYWRQQLRELQRGDMPPAAVPPVEEGP